MQPLKDELLNDDWVFIKPDFKHMYQINIFDNGYETFQDNTNIWVIFGQSKNKIALFNYLEPYVIIHSISRWKTQYL